MPSFFPFPGPGNVLPEAPAAQDAAEEPLVPAPRPARADPTLDSTPPPPSGMVDLAWDDTQPMSVIRFRPEKP
ncbi:hypothetical protein [Polyangium spumosum]|uniref:Uncharacterized protein n=1 Tax=Polyangium spumosum TaxID=889282 RepID=A0A6N7PMS1_9BACT|nr:hypothetical protein [Polyangium spumosum]MRG92096.1 hypothetical protein [Polyangium spumosum]